MASRTVPPTISFDRYLALDERAELKSEYRDGEPFAMSGGTPAQARLASEMIYLLRRQNATGCHIYSSDLRLYIPAVNQAMYPDVTVICGAPEFYQERSDVILNPALLVEVMSPSSANDDRGIKAQLYRQIGSLQVMLLIDSERPYVQTQTRQADGAWTLEEFTQPQQMLVVDRWTLSLGDIYSDILSG